MLKPIVDSSIENVPSRYSLVIGIAKRARQIVDEAEQAGEILVEKPVGLAVEEYLQKGFAIIDPPEEEESVIVEAQPQMAASEFSLEDDAAAEESADEE